MRVGDFDDYNTGAASRTSCNCCTFSAAATATACIDGASCWCVAYTATITAATISTLSNRVVILRPTTATTCTGYRCSSN
jgi:hypothetical protein